MRSFWLRLLAFFLPVALLCSVPMAAMVISRELLPVDQLVEVHANGDPRALLLGSYTNAVKRYKVLTALHYEPSIVALGSSRALGFRSLFFQGAIHTFYNGGQTADRTWNLRRILRRLAPDTHLRALIVTLDQWWFNDRILENADQPGVDAQFDQANDVLGNMSAGMQSWHDWLSGVWSFQGLLRGAPNLGIEARMTGSGLRRDGSMLYGLDQLHPERRAHQEQLKQVLDSIEHGEGHYAFGDTVSEAYLQEVGRFLDDCRKLHLEVVGVLPPFAPTVERALGASAHHTYLRVLPEMLRKLFQARGYSLFDYTSCERLGCSDQAFVDGHHSGEGVYAKMLYAMAEETPWLSAKLDPTQRDLALHGPVDRIVITP